MEEETSELNEAEQESSNGKLPYAMLIVLVLLILALLTLINNVINEFSEKAKLKYEQTPTAAFTEQVQERKFAHKPEKDRFNDIKTGTTEIMTLGIKPLECYNGKTKAEMYELRKKYVKTSMFYSDSYEPNEEVFGRIVDGKNWWGLKALVCNMPNEDNTRGDSALSRFINTPDLLVQAYFPFSMNYDERFKEYCDGEFTRSIPKSLTYDPSDNTITAKYIMSPFVYQNRINYFGKKNIRYPMILSGLNAKDFGYEYVKITNLNNITMLNEHNAAEEVYKFKDFIHLGSSCGYKGGCNNISPRQTELEFNITSLPAEMNMKLWKNKPIFPQLDGDINFKIIFEQE